SENAEYNTLWDAVKQVTYAEEMGFEQVWLVEHHFLSEFAHSSAPEVTMNSIRLFGKYIIPHFRDKEKRARAATC
ncbi:MAG TPA: hypothetical protein VFR55_01395, partial [Dehalococcoidia bacterium]|nr:hypothetical protein [Dehalococcoidia bacterium]